MSCADNAEKIPITLNNSQHSHRVQFYIVGVGTDVSDGDLRIIYYGKSNFGHFVIERGENKG